MSSLKKIWQHAFIFVFFAATSLFSINFAHGLIYCVVFATIISRKKYVELLDVFLASLFLDIYSQAFVGVTFISVVLFYLIARKYRMAFRNFQISMGYFFMALCSCKLFAFLLVNLLGYSFDVRSNFIQVLWALLIYTIYYFKIIVSEDSNHV
ncbi:MAG: hypothetical protein LBJ71_02875 [Holosporaceae bacterium]|jgi:hypothetical protein|nr:hypothetical protein [Holosporaceae bacterium]